MTSTLRSLICLAGLALAHAASAGDLTIEVADVKAGGGNLMVAVYSSAASFLVKPASALGAPATAGSNTLIVRDLPAGEYAVAVYHDANGNGHLDRNPMGMPVEDFAFSNNALGNMGPPTWDQVKLTVPASGLTTHISLR